MQNRFLLTNDAAGGIINTSPAGLGQDAAGSRVLTWNRVCMDTSMISIRLWSIRGLVLASGSLFSVMPPSSTDGGSEIKFQIDWLRAGTTMTLAYHQTVLWHGALSLADAWWSIGPRQHIYPEPICDINVCVHWSKAFPVFSSLFSHLHEAHLWNINCSFQISCLAPPVVAEEVVFNHPDSAERFLWALHRLRGHYLETRVRKWCLRI